MRVIKVVAALLVAASSTVAQGDTTLIFTLKTVTENARWIAVGQVASVREAECSVEGFGSAMIAALDVQDTWKGLVGRRIEFAYFPDKSVVHPLPGARYVIAFQELQVPCANVTYDKGFLPIDGSDVVTSRLEREPRRQSLSELEGKVKSLLASKGK